MTGILWGLLGAGFIGVSDCVARVTAQRVSMSVLFAAVMGVSTVSMAGWAWATGDWPRWDTYGWVASALSGLLNLVALYFLYSALVRGPVTVASPTASSFSVILIAMNGLAGQPLYWQQGVAMGLVFLGVVMLSRRSGSADQFDAAHLRVTALLGLLAAIAVAARMFLAQDAAEILGTAPALLLNRGFALVGVVFLFAYETARGWPRRWPDRSIISLVLLQALLETLALASFLTGSSGEGRIGATIGFASFSAVTAITAWVWLGEPIGWRRGFWMGVVAAGIAVAVLAG
jgi:drug/metabolite transporter (DMT)-like permease